MTSTFKSMTFPTSSLLFATVSKFD